MQSWVETIRFDFTLRMRGASFLLMAGEYVVSLASVDASRVCRGRRMLRKIRLPFGSAGLIGTVLL
jgi:hypothetical protein